MSDGDCPIRGYRARPGEGKVSLAKGQPWLSLTFTGKTSQCQGVGWKSIVLETPECKCPANKTYSIRGHHYGLNSVSNPLNKGHYFQKRIRANFIQLQGFQTDSVTIAMIQEVQSTSYCLRSPAKYVHNINRQDVPSQLNFLYRTMTVHLITLQS